MTPKTAPSGPVKQYIIPITHNEILFDQNGLNDVAVIFDVQAGNLDGSHDRRWEYCFKFNQVATEEELANDLHPFDLLAFPSFPDGYDRLGLRAIIRGGTVACDPRFDYSYDDEDRGDIILFEGLSFGGSSGSPVIAIPKVPPVNVDPNPVNKFRRLLVVGVNAGHLKRGFGEHSGLSYFVRSSVIRRIIEARLAVDSSGSPE